MVDALDFRWPSREEITMKQHWGTDELVEHWTLLPRETELLTNKTGATRLGFAVLLKFFQLEAYFPQHASAVPTVAVEFIAKQVKVAPEQFEQYQWRGRTIEYHRAQIRKLHGFRETTVDDAQALSHWLCEQVLPRERNAERLKSAIYDRCRELHLEPPTPERIDRVVRSAARTYEESFCAEILARLSPDNQASLDALLQPAPDEEHCQLEAKSEMPRALWHTLRSEPGRTSLDTMLEENLAGYVEGDRFPGWLHGYFQKSNSLGDHGTRGFTTAFTVVPLRSGHQRRPETHERRGTRGQL
jgi:hypothetical protein